MKILKNNKKTYIIVSKPKIIERQRINTQPIP